MVVEDLQSLAPWGIHKWRVPEAVKTAGDDVKGAWIAGFADAEGHVRNTMDHKRAIVLTSVNQAGLSDVSRLLTDLGIKHVWMLRHHKDPKCNTAYILQVNHQQDLKKWKDLVGFGCERKMKTLEEALASFERDTQVHHEDTRQALPEIKRRRAAGETWREIAEALGWTCWETVRDICARNGYEPRPETKGKYRVKGYIEKLLPEIVRLRSEGLTQADIAKQLGLKDANTINNALQSHGIKVEMVEGRTQGKRKIEKLLPEIQRMRAEGKSVKQISTELEIPASSIYAAITREKNKQETTTQNTT